MTSSLIKTVYSRLPNWMLVAIVFFTGGYLTAGLTRGDYLVIGGQTYGLFSTVSVGRVTVATTSTDHVNDGDDNQQNRYFNFDGRELAAAMGSQSWEEVDLFAINLRSGRSGLVTIFNGENGGSTGNMHGRFAEWEGSNRQFEIGDRIELVIAMEQQE